MRMHGVNWGCTTERGTGAEISFLAHSAISGSDDSRAGRPVVGFVFCKLTPLVHRGSGSRKSCLPLFTVALRARVTNGATIFPQRLLAVQNRRKKDVGASIF